jgi:hypothetical protein
MSENSIPYRARITGAYKGVLFVFEDPEHLYSNYFWKGENDPSEFWWSDGNMACDCNRSRFLPEGLFRDIRDKCGEDIQIEYIEPIEDKAIPVLFLNEVGED